MAGGGIDIYNSRRGYYEYCRYFNRDMSKSVPLNELLIKEVPDGVFYGKEENTQYDRNIQGGNSFMFDDSFITLSTQDDISNMKPNASVIYQNKVWRVADIQRRKIKKRSEFSEIPNFVTYIQLKV